MCGGEEWGWRSNAKRRNKSLHAGQTVVNEREALTKSVRGPRVRSSVPRPAESGSFELSVAFGGRFQSTRGQRGLFLIPLSLRFSSTGSLILATDTGSRLFACFPKSINRIRAALKHIAILHALLHRLHFTGCRPFRTQFPFKKKTNRSRSSRLTRSTLGTEQIIAHGIAGAEISFSNTSASVIASLVAVGMFLAINRRMSKRSFSRPNAPDRYFRAATLLSI